MSEVISQAAPTLCIQAPMLDVIAAIQTARKTAWRSGLQGEAPGSGLPTSLRLVFPVHDVELDADLVWSAPEQAGRWRAGAAIRRASDGWDNLLLAAG